MQNSSQYNLPLTDVGFARTISWLARLLSLPFPRRVLSSCRAIVCFDRVNLLSALEEMGRDLSCMFRRLRSRSKSLGREQPPREVGVASPSVVVVFSAARMSPACSKRDLLSPGDGEGAGERMRRMDLSSLPCWGE